jgi:tetratricopeptide (TPR) repeat protein
MYQNEDEKAEAQIAMGLAFEAHHPSLRAFGAMLAYYQGEIEKATLVMEDLLEKSPDLYSYRLFLAFCYLSRGERERALDLIDERVIKSARVDQDIAYWLASVYALAGESDEAIKWLECAISMGNENYPWLASDANWDTMRDDPRYQEILRDLKLKWEKLME